MPSGSVCAIVPTFNRCNLLGECLNSILAAGAVIAQVIVVNDGSTDGTRELVRSYGPRVTLIDKPNGGKSSALNLGLKQCRQEFVWICDDDDLAADGGIQRLADALNADPQAGFAFGTYDIFRESADGRTFSNPPRFMRENEPNVHLQFLEEMFTFQYATLVRMQVYDRVGPFNETLVRSQDFDMMLRLARRASAVFVPAIIFHQRSHEGTRGSATHSFAAGDARRKWLEFDKQIFARIRADYDLDEFTPTFAKGWAAPRAQRAALVERGCVFAARAMWGEAIADFQAAVAAEAGPFAAEELGGAEAIIRSELAWFELGASKAWKADLRAIRRGSAAGRQLVEACLRPLLWQARQLTRDGHRQMAAMFLGTMVEVLGLRGAARRVGASLRS